jgi:hypothetical protein
MLAVERFFVVSWQGSLSGLVSQLLKHACVILTHAWMLLLLLLLLLLEHLRLLGL